MHEPKVEPSAGCGSVAPSLAAVSVATIVAISCTYVVAPSGTSSTLSAAVVTLATREGARPATCANQIATDGRRTRTRKGSGLSKPRGAVKVAVLCEVATSSSGGASPGKRCCL